MALPAPIIVPQIQLSDLDLYAAQGVSTVISCRPDDEEPNQLTFQDVTGLQLSWEWRRSISPLYRVSLTKRQYTALPTFCVRPRVTLLHFADQANGQECCLSALAFVNS